MASAEPQLKKFRQTILSDHFLKSDYQDQFRKNWSNNLDYSSSNLQIISSPFRLCKISNFLNSQNFLDELKLELADIKSRRSSIDLYQFEQTSDLSLISTDNIQQLRDTFISTLKPWMEENTGIQLNSTMSMSSSCYFDTDYLLCHDDNLSDRKIAFILYLSPNWLTEDGGTLDLFDTDPSSGLPRNVVKSLVPEYNSLVFFEVTDNSYHQVAEITSSTKSRWSINGWFHGPVRPNNRPPRPSLDLPTFEPIKESTQELNTWIMDSYLCTGIMRGIRESMEKQSYNFLAHFLKGEIYEKLYEDILSDDIVWKKVGPADVRNYEIADDNTMPLMLKNFYNLFKTLDFFKLLKDYTELDLVPDGKDMKPKMTIELQRWTKGSYTLICDKNYGDEEGVELIDKEGERMKMLVLRQRTDSTSSHDNNTDDEEIRVIIKNSGKRKKKIDEQASCSGVDNRGDRSPPLHPDSEDSEVSDIGDYLSGDSEHEDDDCGSGSGGGGGGGGGDEEEEETEPGTLDVIMQFHTGHLNEEDTIDYVDPKEPDGALINIPPEDNHLCLVYKTLSTSRVQKYVNHYCEGYFYNLICTYHE